MADGGSAGTNGSLQNILWMWTSSLWQDTGSKHKASVTLSLELRRKNHVTVSVKSIYTNRLCWNIKESVQCRQGEIWFPTCLCSQHRTQTEAVTLLQIKASGPVCYLIFALLRFHFPTSPRWPVADTCSVAAPLSPGVRVASLGFLCSPADKLKL